MLLKILGPLAFGNNFTPLIYSYQPFFIWQKRQKAVIIPTAICHHELTADFIVPTNNAVISLLHGQQSTPFPLIKADSAW